MQTMTKALQEFDFSVMTLLSGFGVKFTQGLNVFTMRRDVELGFIEEAANGREVVLFNGSDCGSFSHVDWGLGAKLAPK